MKTIKRMKMQLNLNEIVCTLKKRDQALIEASLLYNLVNCLIRKSLSGIL